MKCSYAEHPKDTLSLLTELKKKQNRTEVIVQWGTACLAMVGLGFNPWYPKSLVSGSDPCPQTESGVSSKHYLNIISLWLHHHHQETKYIIMKKTVLIPRWHDYDFRKSQRVYKQVIQIRKRSRKSCKRYFPSNTLAKSD